MLDVGQSHVKTARLPAARTGEQQTHFIAYHLDKKRTSLTLRPPLIDSLPSIGPS
jgi:hypothetical protein